MTFRSVKTLIDQAMNKISATAAFHQLKTRHAEE